MTSTLDAIRPRPTLPPLRGIYAGKYKERNPDLVPAGVASNVGGESAANAIQEIPRPESPEATKKFHRTFRSDPGQRIVFYGKASDPQLKWAESMTHGVKYPRGEGAAHLLNPTPLTFYQQRFLDRLEASQVNAKKRPLGRCPDGRELGLLPKDMDKCGTTFGITVEKFGTAGELLNPNESRVQLETTAAADANTYLVSHKALVAGEQASRGYPWRPDSVDKRWGKPTPHDNAGSGTRKCMSWIADERAARADQLVEKRLDDFRERTQPQLGRPLDPIKDTMKVPPDHTFGVLHKPDPYGVGDLLHGRAPKHFLRGEDRRRALLAALRTQLKTMNYERFGDLAAAFQFYDKSGCGKLSAADIRAACAEMSVPLDDSLLEQLIDFCDVNNDGFIDYREFANFLNWRDISVRSAHTFGKASLADSDACKLTRQIDQSIATHKTTNSMYSAAVGRYDPGRFRTYGCPTIRSDLPAPAVRSVCDRKAYGDEGDAAACLNPSIFTSHGVFEHDLALPRSREEIECIFSAAGIALDAGLVCRAFALGGSDRLSIDEFRRAWAAVAAQEVAVEQKKDEAAGCCC